MSKERLEEIKRNIVGIFDMESGRIESVDIRKEDYEWLIEQVDRGVEYDRYLISLEDNKHYVTGLEQQNKRYREAIEVAIHNMAASDNLGVKFALGILEQALESEK